MKIKFLGTAAAEAFPAMFCDCEMCRKATELGGRNIRTRSQTLIDDDMLIDFPCDTYFHLVQNNINLLDIKHCLITHIHQDHFFPDDLSWLKNGFSHPPKNWHGLTVYGSEDIKKPLSEKVAKGLLNCEVFAPFKSYKIGDYTVTPLKALHGTKNPYIYIIQKENKAFLYAHDTGIFLAETWKYLKNSGICFDAVSLDCNEGASMKIPYDSHMCLGDNIKCRDKLMEYNLADENTKFILNHFSHNGENCVYEDFSKVAEKHGFLTSYDGYELEI